MTAKRGHREIDICANCVSHAETDDNEVIKCDNEMSDHYQHYVTYTHYSCIFFDKVIRGAKE